MQTGGQDDQDPEVKMQPDDTEENNGDQIMNIYEVQEEKYNDLPFSFVWLASVHLLCIVFEWLLAKGFLHTRADSL